MQCREKVRPPPWGHTLAFLPAVLSSLRHSESPLAAADFFFCARSVPEGMEMTPGSPRFCWRYATLAAFVALAGCGTAHSTSSATKASEAFASILAWYI